MVIFLVVFGGIYGGIFSPTEGAAVGAVATFVAALARRELGLQGIKRSFIGTAETSAMVFMIFLGADMMNSALALTQMPARVADWVGHLQVAPLWIVGASCALHPARLRDGRAVDDAADHPGHLPGGDGAAAVRPGPEDKAIWFGILVLMTVGIGMMAPPVGLNVYVVNSIARDVPMQETYKGVCPFLASDVLRMLVLLFFPSLTLGLVKWLY